MSNFSSKIKVVYIISDLDKALAFEWIAEKIDGKKFDLSFILLNPASSFLEEHLIQKGYNVYYIRCRGKRDWLPAFIRVWRLLRKIKPSVVHCHLIQATIIGLAAAKVSGVKKRIYTRHHSSLHHVYIKKGRWWDKFSNNLATNIVAASGAVKKILINWERVPERKVVVIPHGFKLSEFANVSRKRIEDFKTKNNLNGTHPVIGVISRLTKWKGVQYTVVAFQRYLACEPRAVILLLNAKGDFESEIQRLLNEIPSSNYRKITFESDIAAAYKAMDVFIHVPIDEHSEAFGQAYIEALAAEVPAIFTLSGIAPDFITNEENALIVPFKDSDAIFKAMQRIVSDKKLQNRLRKEGLESVQKKFELSYMMKNLEDLYAE